MKQNQANIYKMVAVPYFKKRSFQKTDENHEEYVRIIDYCTVLNTLILFVEEYKLICFSLRNFLQSPLHFSKVQTFPTLYMCKTGV